MALSESLHYVLTNCKQQDFSSYLLYHISYTTMKFNLMQHHESSHIGRGRACQPVCTFHTQDCQALLHARHYNTEYQARLFDIDVFPFRQLGRKRSGESETCRAKSWPGSEHSSLRRGDRPIKLSLPVCAAILDVDRCRQVLIIHFEILCRVETIVIIKPISASS